MDQMVECLMKEIDIRKNYLSEPVETIYFGGGTPSLLTSVQLSHLIKKVREEFDVISNSEITLEANPDDLSKGKLLEFKNAGINRLSIGVQSFDSTVLQFLNRAHNDKQASNCIELSKQEGFDNISVDLIYGIPNRSHVQWKEDLKKLIAFDPAHISAYCLTIEPKTAFGHWLKKGKLKPVEDDYSAEQFEIMLDLLEKAGYEQYEISNFSKPTYYSKHNTAYWQQKPYLGIGPSAHSYNLTSRQYNISNNQKYMVAIGNGESPSSLEKLTWEDQINDYLLTTLRTKWGSDLTVLQKMGYLLDPQYVQELIHAGHAALTNNHLVLTKRGRLLADQISADLFIVDN